MFHQLISPGSNTEPGIQHSLIKYLCLKERLNEHTFQKVWLTDMQPVCQLAHAF